MFGTTMCLLGGGGRRSGTEGKTRKLQDEFLDIDLLDQQARKILGLIRLDEIIIIE